MRIALITDGIWPYVLGGMQKHSFYLCKYLAQKKIEVDVYHFNNSNYDISLLEFFTDEERQYIHSYVIPFPKGRAFPGHYLFYSYQYSRTIFNEIKNKLSSYQFIYSKGFSAWYLIEQKHKSKVICPPIGIKFHGYEMFQKPPNYKTKWQHLLLLRWPVRMLSKHADYVFSYGAKITDIIRSIGVSEKKIIELPSGVEESTLISSIRPTQHILKFLFLGRYERRKGIEELNQAIESIHLEEGMQNVEFHFVGPIPDTKRINRSGVFYHGEIRDKGTLTALIRNCDMLVCPSWSEGMPNVILEAMANGLAVMATDVGATRLLVSEQTGWLLKDSTAETIKLSLQEVMKCSKTEIDLKKQNALYLIQSEYTWEKLIDTFCTQFLSSFER